MEKKEKRLNLKRFFTSVIIATLVVLSVIQVISWLNYPLVQSDCITVLTNETMPRRVESGATIYGDKVMKLEYLDPRTKITPLELPFRVSDEITIIVEDNGLAVITYNDNDFKNREMIDEIVSSKNN